MEKITFKATGFKLTILCVILSTWPQYALDSNPKVSWYFQNNRPRLNIKSNCSEGLKDRKVDNLVNNK